MLVRSRSGGSESEAESRTLSDAAVKAIGSWVGQFGRTLKTCRLYDATNPTVIKFREDLFGALQRLVGEFGAFTLRFMADDVTCDGVSLHPSRSREDNLAFVFHRDGVRGLLFESGVTSSELEQIVDAVLLVSGQNLEGDDLVTLLWEADLRNVSIDYIPAEGDLGGAEAPPDAAGAGEALLPWPAASEISAEELGDEPTASASDHEERSEDWLLGDLTIEVEATFAELDALAPAETERFRREYDAEHGVPSVAAAIAIANACMHASANLDDQQEMLKFLPRVLRSAMATGRWADASDALRLVRESSAGAWSDEGFVQELMQPVSIARSVEQLDRQESPQIADCLAFSAALGDPGIDWLTLLLCDSQRQEARIAFAEALAQRCRTNPERLAAWLADPRWYVVRNIVTILGWIGGPAVAGLLQTALRNSEPRVHAAVIAAMANVELRHARPVLIRALDSADSRLFAQILQQLSGARDPATARFVFAFVQQERFQERPSDERRAIYAAIASVGGDELVGELEAELLKGNWFDREQEIHRHAIARCLALIGTPYALTVLHRGAASKREPVRLACATALSLTEAA